MPTLEWIGKGKVINHHLDVPFHVLERQYSFDTEGKHTEDNGSENMIIHGDNLTALKSLLPKYEGKINCIYIDPPYNTGNEKWVYNDNVNDPQIKKWLGEVVGTEGEDLSRHDKWLCMMYPRLRLLHKLLADNGAIFISIDDNEQANLKLICDEIFGANKFVNCISINMNSLSGVKMTHAINGKRYPAQKEYLLIYKKNRVKFNIEKLHKGNWDKEYNMIIPELKEGQFARFQEQSVEVVNSQLAEMTLQSVSAFAKENNIELTEDWFWKNSYRIVGTKSNRPLAKQVRDNTYTQIILAYRNNDGNVRFFRTDFNRQAKDPRIEIVQAEANSSVFLSDSWIDISTDGGIAQEGGIIFPNGKKPLKLIMRILNSICDANALILDSFAGSGTTAHAVLNLNKQDGGNRKFILVELMDYADSITAERVKRVIKGYGAGDKVVEGTGGDFSFYELGEQLMKDGVLNEAVGTDKIREYIYYTETKQNLQNKANEPYYLGSYAGTAYYFNYIPNEVTRLDDAFLGTIKTTAERYVVYADVCTLGKTELEKYNITFKKIPRDIEEI